MPKSITRRHALLGTSAVLAGCVINTRTGGADAGSDARSDAGGPLDAASGTPDGSATAGLDAAHALEWAPGPFVLVATLPMAIDLSPTLPAGTPGGGTFAVDASGQVLPSGVTLSAAGKLSGEAATPGASAEVVFAYTAGSTTLLSKPTRVFVQEAPRFADGTEAGTFAADVWTPGRNAQGVVNQVSWDLVPKGRWVTVAGTRLDALDAEVKAAIPGWNDYGSSRWGGVAHAWNGVAIDEQGCRAWWICAGGHADSSNNGIYRFDAYKMAYAIEHLPSDTNQWSERYRKLQDSGTFTYCGESDREFQGSNDAGSAPMKDGWFYDELFWDRQPTSRHVYSGVLFLASSNELIMAVRRLWRYSLTTGQWTSKRIAGDNPRNNLGEENIVEYDQSTNRLLTLACGSGGPWGDTFDLDTDSWLGQPPPGTGWDLSGGADNRHGNTVTIFRGPEAPEMYASPGRYLSYDVVTRQVLASGNVQLEGFALTDFPKGQDGTGMVYIPVLDRYWVAMRTKAGEVGWYELDPTTTPWTFRALAPQAGIVPALDGGSTLIRRRMVWMPSMSAVVFLGSASKDISLYRF
ncbi:MAG: hypothetical protein QM765_13050 [Myxococcales bacterium]